MYLCLHWHPVHVNLHVSALFAQQLSFFSFGNWRFNSLEIVLEQSFAFICSCYLLRHKTSQLFLSPHETIRSKSRGIACYMGSNLDLRFVLRGVFIQHSILLHVIPVSVLKALWENCAHLLPRQCQQNQLFIITIKYSQMWKRQCHEPSLFRVDSAKRVSECVMHIEFRLFRRIILRYQVPGFPELLMLCSRYFVIPL